MGAGESDMLSPGPPTHSPLARAHWVCPVPMFPSSTVGHPGDVRAGETGSDKARSVADPAAPWGENTQMHNRKMRFVRVLQGGH